MKPLYWIFAAVLLLITFYLEFTYLADYESHWWNQIPGFYALFGFICCTLIIFVAKFIAKKVVNRDIHYYD